ncbi:serine protease [Linnemannia zychae]|nr:serine protease [Linnemannia zychae]
MLDKLHITTFANNKKNQENSGDVFYHIIDIVTGRFLLENVHIRFLIPTASFHSSADKPYLASRLSLAEETSGVKSMKIIPDSYIVIFKAQVHAYEDDSRRSGNEEYDSTESIWNETVDCIQHIYNSGAFQGLASCFSSSALHTIRSHSAVAYVERDLIGHLTELKTQNDSPWCIASLSRCHSFNTKQVNDTTSPQFKYTPDSHGGSNITMFEIDTDYAEWGIATIAGGKQDDNHGHEIHCAGTIASRAFGIYKAAYLVAVKVFGENGHELRLVSLLGSIV